MLDVDAVVNILGSCPEEPHVEALLSQSGGSKSASIVKPEIKAYPDVVYHNFPTLGLSLQYEAASPGTDASQAAPQDLRLAAVDIYSGHNDQKWTCFPSLPLRIAATAVGGGTKPCICCIKSHTTGKDLVTDLGEPQRKGGGANDRSGPAAWMEWSLQPSGPDSHGDKHFTLQIELAGAAARGADRWNADRAGACKWAIITIS